MQTLEATPFSEKHRQARLFPKPAQSPGSSLHPNSHEPVAYNTTATDTPAADRYTAGLKIDWADLIDSKATLPIQITLEQVRQYFRDHPGEKYAAVLQEGRIVGLCSELGISRKLTLNRGLGYQVYAKTTLDRHLEPSHLMIRRGSPVAEVLNQVMFRTEGFFDDVILTDGEGKFLGLIHTQTLVLLQHRINRQHLESLESLTRKLNDNNIELGRARDVAMQAAEMKSTFLANMSHEIRTPLNGILGMVRILMRTGLAPQQRRYSTAVLNSANALLTILNDILDFSKIEAGKMTFEQVHFDLSDLVEESVQLLAERAREKKIGILSWIDIKADTRIISDSARIRQVILNLVSNAVKFTEKGEIVVRIDQEKETDTHVSLKISVKDSGIGITRETRERLFLPFEQGDRSTSRKFGGTGLGLAISKKIVELLGGTIGCESEPGQGSTFWFRLELPKQPALPASARRREDDLWGLRILVIDGSTTFGSYLEQHMNKWKVLSRVTQDAATALEIARTHADRGTVFDVVVADYNLQSQDALELARQFQADPRLARSRFVILTSFENEIGADNLRLPGIAGTLSKPVKPSELYETLCHCIRQRTQPVPGANPVTAVPEIRDPSWNVPPLELPVQAPPARTASPGPEMATTPSSPVDHAAIFATDQERSCPPLNLLLVEDSEVNREVALILLNSWGHTLDTAENGQLAVERLKTHRYDGVLMDCQMPVMDGYEATKTVRDPSSPVLQHDIPIVAMTANAMPGDRDLCLRSGMTDYLGKPIDEAELLGALLRIAEAKNRPSPVIPEAQTAVSTSPVVDPSEKQTPAGNPEPVVAPSPIDTCPAPSGDIPQDHPQDHPQAPSSRTGDDAEDIEPYFPARLINLFISETESRIHELHESLNRGDMAMIMRISHTIKGTAGNFRAHRLYEITREIEKLARDSQTDSIRPLVVQALETFHTFKSKHLQPTPIPSNGKTL